MKAEVVGVGTELLLGQIVDTNAAWIGERLAEIGVDVLHHQVVGDNVGRIVEVLTLALSRSDAVIVTGGLGPTQDDVTRHALAEATGVALERRPELAEMIRERFTRAGREMPLSNLVQADLPAGARAIVPRRGTAPGIVVDLADRRVYAVPGVPAEMREMMEGTVLPELAAAAGPATIVSRIVRCVGIAESRVAELLDDVFQGSTNPTVAYLAGGGEVKVRLTAKAPTAEEAGAMLVPAIETVVERVGDFVTSTSDEDLEEVVGRLLRAAGSTVACAESLTAGSLSARLARVPGASDYLLGSAVTYGARAKRDLLGVSEATLAGPGVVSRECAAEMAAGARRAFGADLGLALTGAAGPEPHDGAEPGTAWVALDGEEIAHQRKIRAPGDRPMVVRWSEQAALDLVRRHLEGRPLPDAEPVVR
ncbi:MAG TPA: competence/damage-inducible protein A [Actinomycetota bacterium]